MKCTVVDFVCTCGMKQSHVAWDNKEKTGIKCKNNDCKIKLTLSMAAKKNKTPEAPGIRTPTKNRV